ncbi:MAG: hypothetical protein ABI835_19185, partial [Chloroflexota bacterium]
MLRLLAPLSLGILTGFFVIGALIFRAWGWSEYASDELYLAYTLLTPEQPYPRILMNTADSHEQSQLTWNNGTIIALACSPDGHSLAFLTDTAHLYV